MITKEQAMTANDFHEEHSAIVVRGPRGKMNYPKIYNWRRNGRTKTWVREPNRFQVPIKYGLRSYDYITEFQAHMFHTAEDCPLVT